MFPFSMNQLKRIGACLIFVVGLMAAPNLRTTEILAEDAGHERSGNVHLGMADLTRRNEAFPFSEDCIRCSQIPREGSLRRLRNIARLAANSSGHLQSGHRLANGILAPQLL